MGSAAVFCPTGKEPPTLWVIYDHLLESAPLRPKYFHMTRIVLLIHVSEYSHFVVLVLCPVFDGLSVVLRSL